MGGGNLFVFIVFVPILVLVSLLVKPTLQKSLSGIPLIVASVTCGFLICMFAFVFMTKSEYGLAKSVSVFFARFLIVGLLVLAGWIVKDKMQAKT